MQSLMIPWLISALSALFMVLAATLWHRKTSFLSEELQRLRHTLNSWETQPAPVQAHSDRALEMRMDSLRNSTTQLAKQISAKSSFDEPEECVSFFREAITTLSRANRKSKDQLSRINSELKSMRGKLADAEHALEETTDDPSTMSHQMDDVQQLLAITMAERDQLKWRVQELTSNMRKG